MKFLMEHEMGFDANCLGFPSIQGCHAIVYQTNAGLYGFHVAGGSGNDDWQPNATLFSQFITAHGGLASRGTRVYGASFVGNNQRGYSAPAKNRWKEELVVFATAVNYAGKISGYDLYKTLGDNASAYVEYRQSGDKCDLHIRQWATTDHPARVANPDRPGHKIKHKRYGSAPTLQELDNVVTGVNRTSLTHVSKKRLR